jgi:hypothetical protein
MLTRLRTTWLAGGGAVLLILAVTGFAAGAALVADTTPTVAEPDQPDALAPDTTLTFEDADGNGIDDDCDQAAVVANATLAAAALAAADLNGDGTISVSEAAQTDWIGGPNCNHGGYVSQIARSTDDGCDAADATETETGTEDPSDGTKAEDADNETDVAPVIVPVVATVPTDTCTEAPAEEPLPAEDPVPAVCVAVAAPVPAPVDPTVDPAPNAHGKAVSAVAQSDAIGGKNCNHGGAVSEAAHKDKAATDAAKDAAKKTHGAKGHGKGHAGGQ